MRSSIGQVGQSSDFQGIEAQIAIQRIADTAITEIQRLQQEVQRNLERARSQARHLAEARRERVA